MEAYTRGESTISWPRLERNVLSEVVRIGSWWMHFIEDFVMFSVVGKKLAGAIYDGAVNRREKRCTQLRDECRECAELHVCASLGFPPAVFGVKCADA